jgi:hypothetical protein
MPEVNKENNRFYSRVKQLSELFYIKGYTKLGWSGFIPL